METVAPDILADVRQLSAVFAVLGLVIGMVLWLAGWWTHRFWVVLGMTVLGGFVGLHNTAVLQTQPLVAALGVGLAAGILALTLVRIGAFVAGGYAGLMLVHAWSPAWDQPFISFLAGGFLGWLLVRYWTMVLTSLTGVLLILYSVLALGDKFGKLDAVLWSDRNAITLNALCAAMTLSGFLVQFVADWLRKRGAHDDKSNKKDGKDSKKHRSGGVLAALPSFRRAS
jgi:hypothetical protein